jgi:nitrogen fixation protein FixH
MTTIRPPGIDPPVAPPGRAWTWPLIVVGLLGGQIAACMAALALALGDPAGAIEENYHARAVSHDQHQAQRQALLARGWRPDLAIDTTLDSRGRRTVAFRLADQAGLPIDGATVRMTAFAHATAKTRHEARLHPASGGLYLAAIPMGPRGVWEFRFTIEHQGATFAWSTLAQPPPLTPEAPPR